MPTGGVATQHKRAGLAAYAACIRYRDVLILQGSPLLGMAFAVRELTAERLASMVICAFASSLLVAHIFSFNDWAGIALDSNDPNKSADVFVTRGISRHGVAVLSAVLLGAALSLLTWLPRPTLLLGIAIAALGALYSHPAFDAKGTPVVSSLPHLVGGALHFLLGYSVFSPIDQRGVLIALYFALTFTAGHLNQEVRDYDGDRLNGIRTNAVAFGKTAAFVAGLGLFTLAYADLFLLAWRGIVPTPLAILPVLLYPAHVWWSVRTLRGGLSFTSVSRLQNRYRLLYAVIGVAMIGALFVR
jgi:lycopene elongase/hydratase (dihydrobisanhydrobacterioruberin-forming)